ncbi:MAG: histidinol-phosphate transaminase [Deltaproteobacteria bacterium]|nr:histidinol-phosphate transaminase [Deltaproteobacteria bacterium]
MGYRDGVKTQLSDVMEHLTPYTPGEQPKDGAKVVKLNTNENPYPPSPRVLEAIKAAANASLRLYPHPDAGPLRAAAAQHFGVTEEQVFWGNGSDEVLAFAFLALFQKSQPLLFPDITYSFYPVYAKLFGIPVQQVPLAADFSIDLSQYAQDAGGVVFANPNAPTSLSAPAEAIEAFASQRPATPVVVDEAYMGFGAASALPLVEKYPNVLVVRTLSKSHSLAGLRVGMALGHPRLIDALQRVKHSFNSYAVDRLAIAGAMAALADSEYYDHISQQIVATRDKTTQALRALGFIVLDSSANFVFAKPAGISAKELFEALRARGILVRYFDKPRIDEYLRITMGTAEEMQGFVDAVGAIVSSGG